MSRIAVLVPKENMVEMAECIIEEEKIGDILMVKQIDVENSVYEARMAVSQGAEIIVARGAQAAFIKKYTKVPVVEMIFSGQEMALLVEQAKTMTDRNEPSIALIGFKNMFPDTSYFDRIFHVRLSVYYLGDISDAAAVLEQAAGEGADVVIGGMTVGKLARERGIPSIFLEAREDQVRDALRVASKMLYAAELEKNQNAQFETVVQATFNGIIKINREREITIANHIVETLLGKKEDRLAGTDVCAVVPGLSEHLVEDVLLGKRDVYTTSIYLKGSAFTAMAAPIQLDSKIVGAIISFYRMADKSAVHESTAKEMLLRGYNARYRFTDLKAEDAEMKKCLERAKLFAISKKPILLYGEPGTEKEILAQCIHNNSAYNSGPFININCSGMTEEMQLTRLFGNPFDPDPCLKKGALATSNNGTILISDIDMLAPACQYRLFRAIRFEELIQNDIERSLTLNNRVIATSKNNLMLCVREGNFREDLFYLFNGLMLEIPPLRERPEDLRRLIGHHRETVMHRYSKYVRVSEDAMERLLAYDWPGNELQLESFCERMFLSAKNRMIREDFVQYLLDELYPAVRMENNEAKMVVYRHPEAVKIADLLEKYNGNRARVAQELAISTTTLWRRMKKYGILNKYEL